MVHIIVERSLEQATHNLNDWNRLPTIWTTGTGYPLSERLEQATIDSTEETDRELVDVGAEMCQEMYRYQRSISL